MMLFIALSFSIVAILLMRSKGCFTDKLKYKIAALLCHVVSIGAFTNQYGAARGFFIYLGIIALVGMTYTLTRTNKIKES